jgi:hypothetical protein
MARTFTAILVTLWLGSGLFIREPHWVFLPLWGLFPGDCSFHGSPSQMAALWGWIIAVGAALLALVFVALQRNSKLAAGMFAIALLFSGYIAAWRAV